VPPATDTTGQQRPSPASPAIAGTEPRSADSLLERSVPLEAHLDGLLLRLAERGVESADTLVALSTCRDELVAELAAAVDARWGHPFTVGGLGGIPALGPTGWQTALSHVPAHGGRGAVLVLGTTHIGITSDGMVGATLRVGQDEASATCGALVAVNDAIRTDADHGCPFDDHELQTLWTEVHGCSAEDRAELDTLTITLAGRIDDAVTASVLAARAWEDTDVAVCTGVHVHHPDGDRILPVRSTFTGPDGRPTPL
jgi:hypothetical protein